jgi:hypothetical protein
MGWVQHVGPSFDEVEARLGRFESCSEETGTRLAEAYAVDEGAPHTLCLVRRPYRAESGGYARGYSSTVTVHETRLLGLFALPAEAGQVLIRPESITDKIVEMFKRHEVDFDDSPRFSSRYYVLATDEAALREAMTPKALDILGERTDLFAEIHGRDMVVAWPAVPDPDDIEEPADFFADLAEAIGVERAAPYR